MSPELKSFYQAYAAWLDAGAPSGEPFNRWCGLCSNVAYNYKALAEMEQQFKDAGLDPTHPFHETLDEYFKEGDEFRSHLNPKRIAWVREHAA